MITPPKAHLPSEKGLKQNETTKKHIKTEVFGFQV